MSGVIALFLSFVGVESAALAVESQPGWNVLVVSFDALRADALGCYGSPRLASPTMDAFARDGVRFANAYTVAPVTPTSFAAAFTGRLPTRVFHRWKLIEDDTLAARFAAAGYETAAFMNNGQLGAERHFDRGFEIYELFDAVEDDSVEGRVVEWLAGSRTRPFFAWVHFLSPHSPYDWRESSARFYDPTYEGKFETTSGSRFEATSSRDIGRLLELYHGEVFHGDARFRGVLDALDVAGLADHTIVVLTSDHGEEFGEHDEFQHDRLTEEHVRIPLIVRHPGVAGGITVEEPVSNLDLFPTLLGLTGLPVGDGLDGHDLMVPRAPEELDLVGVSMTGGKRRWLSYRSGSMKLIQTCVPDRRRVLYDLDADPAERRDIAASRSDIVTDLARRLADALAGEPCDVMQAAVRGSKPSVGLSKQRIEALRALGYLDDE